MGAFATRPKRGRYKDDKPAATVEPVVELDGAPLERPAEKDPKAAWIEYALAEGHPLDAVEAATKAELIEMTSA